MNLEEVTISGKSPRSELYAPRVRGRDFVSDRLVFEIREVELNLGLYKSHFERIKKRVELGVIHKNELDALQSEIASKNMTIDNIKKKLDLRSLFVGGKISAKEIEIKDRITVAERNLYVARTQVETLNKQIKQLEDRVAVGLVSQIELTQMQYALNAAQAELDLANLEMDVLDKIR